MALNHIDLMGRLVTDPELKTVGADVHVASLRMAVDRDRKNKETGDRESDFFNVTAWRGTADFAAQYFQKGDPIVVSGRLQSRSYEDKDGNKRTAYDIVAENIYFGGPKTNNGTANVENTSDATTHEDLPF